MAFWVVLALILAAIVGYVKVFGKKTPCDCAEKAGA